LLTGPNGSGKTNVLEAISFLSSSKGLHQAPLGEILTTTAPPFSHWSVSAQIQTPSGILDLGTGLEKASWHHPGERRIAKIHHKFAKSLSTFDNILWLLWLTPAMDRIFVDALHKRRKFFDHLVGGLFPKHKTLCVRYKVLLKERMRVLLTRPSDNAWLSALEKRLAHVGVQITIARHNFLKLLTPILPTTPAPFPSPAIRLHETYDQQDASEEVLSAAFEKSRVQDTQTGSTAFGPHRTEWDVRFIAKDLPAAACSTGEQKALLLSIILATACIYRAHRQSVPLLLLDDFAAHLDAHKQAVLWETLKDLSIQTWFTGVTSPHFSATNTDLQHFVVERGICTPSSFAREL
jgi:DNA replication and repair protein RecF